MGFLEAIEKKRQEVIKKRQMTGEGTLGSAEGGLQKIANDLAKKRKKATMQPMEKTNAK